jgi:hypothetical protein
VFAACGGTAPTVVTREYVPGPRSGCQQHDIRLLEHIPVYKASTPVLDERNAITGVITDVANNDRVFGATVAATPIVNEWQAVYALTDELGRYRLEVMPGMYRVTVYQDDRLLDLGVIDVP